MSFAGFSGSMGGFGSVGMYNPSSGGGYSSSSYSGASGGSSGSSGNAVGQQNTSNLIGAGLNLGGFFTGQNQANQANAQANQAQGTVSSLLGDVQQNVNSQTSQYGQYYSPLLSGLSQGYSSDISSANAQNPQLISTLLNAGLNPSALNGLTGINANQLTGNLTNYASNTAGTNLAQQTPGALQFYQNEAQNGINPQYALNAQNQVQQGLAQNINTAMNQAQPGQNMNALVQNLDNNALQQQANLGGQLAGLSQQYSNTGEQGLLGAAQGLDTQNLNMLQAANTAGTAANQQAFNNLGTSATAGQGLLTAGQGFLGQGQGQINAATNAASSGTYAAQSAANAAQARAASAQGSANSGLGGIIGDVAGLFGGL